MSHARAIWSTNSMLLISIFQIEEWPWCRRPAIWAKPNSYFVTHPSQNGIRLQTLLSHQSALIAAQVRFVCPFSQKQNRLFQSQNFGLEGDWGVCLLLPSQTYYLLFSGRGAPWLGGGVVGRVAGMFRPCGIQNFGSSKCLQVVLILHAVQMMRIWNLHSTQKQDMQFYTWSKSNTESKDTFHRISNRVKNKMLNKYH